MEQNIEIARALLDGIAGGRDPAQIAAGFAENLSFEIQGDNGVLSLRPVKTPAAPEPAAICNVPAGTTPDALIALFHGHRCGRFLPASP